MARRSNNEQVLNCRQLPKRDGVVNMAKEDPRTEAMSGVGIIDLERKYLRNDIIKLRHLLLEIIRKNGDEDIPENILTKDAKVIDDVGRIVTGFDIYAYRPTTNSLPIKYESGVSDEVAEMFCYGEPMPVPDVTRANLDDLLRHLSQIFSLRRKASFIQMMRFNVLDDIEAHVAKQSVDYEKFERSINVARYVSNRIASSPADQMQNILMKVRMGGVSDSEIEEYLTANTNDDMGELNSLIEPTETENSESGDEATTLYIQHINGQIGMDLL